MEVEQNTISRDWTVLREGRRFHVNFTESDGWTLGNRDNWQISEETEDGIEEFGVCGFNDSIPGERKRAEETARIIDELVAFCIENWENEFVREVQENMEEQRKNLERQDAGGLSGQVRTEEKPPRIWRERKRDNAGACRLIAARAIRAHGVYGSIRGDDALSFGVR